VLAKTGFCWQDILALHINWEPSLCLATLHSRSQFAVDRQTKLVGNFWCWLPWHCWHPAHQASQIHKIRTIPGRLFHLRKNDYKSQNWLKKGGNILSMKSIDVCKTHEVWWLPYKWEDRWESHSNSNPKQRWPTAKKLINKALNCAAAIFIVICHINRAGMKHMPWINPSINHSRELPNHHMSPVNMPENICWTDQTL